MVQARSSLLLVDDDDDLRESFEDLVASLDGRRDVLAAMDVDAMIALGPRALDCGLAILDVNLGAGKPSGIAALMWLRDHGFRGKAVFLTGHGRSNPEVEKAEALQGVPVLGKPIGTDEIVSLIESTP